MKLVDPKVWAFNHANEPPILYVAHPVAPRVDQLEHMPPESVQYVAQATVSENLRSALAWWRWLEGSLTEIVFAMPWYVNVSANGNGDPALIERGLRDDIEIVQRLDGVVLCGNRVSSGMLKEATAAFASGRPVFQIPGNRDGTHPVRDAREQPWHEWRPA